MKMGNKIFSILFISSIVFSVFSSAEDINSGNWHVHLNIGYQIPPDPIKMDYGSSAGLGIGSSYSIGSFRVTSEYLHNGYNSFTPITNLEATMDITHLFLGVDYTLSRNFFRPFLGAGLAYAFVEEEVVSLGSYSNSGVGFYLSAGFRTDIQMIETAIVFRYSSVILDEIDVGGIFILFQIGI